MVEGIGWGCCRFWWCDMECSGLKFAREAFRWRPKRDIKQKEHTIQISDSTSLEDDVAFHLAISLQI